MTDHVDIQIMFTFCSLEKKKEDIHCFESLFNCFYKKALCVIPGKPGMPAAPLSPFSPLIAEVMKFQIYLRLFS